MDMERYARNQSILDNLKMSMIELNDIKVLLLNELIKVEKQLVKHEELVNILKKEIDE